jgi:SAM-dependent methyltransferase
MGRVSPDPSTDPAVDAADAPDASARETFIERARRALADGTFEALVLSANRAAGGEPGTVRVRAIALRGAPALSFVESHATRDVTRNLAVEDGLAAVAAMLDPASRPSFAHATLQAGADDLQLRVSKKGRATLSRGTRTPARRPTPADTALTNSAALAPHDRQRPRRLSIDEPFLVELGITDTTHRLVPAMARKWRQIDKFLEVVDDALDALPARSADAAARPIRVVDFGCGKGYLTFAVHAHLRRRFGVAPEVVGVELRPELVAFCNGVAERTGAAGLRFVEGDLRSHVPEAVDVMIALHACDTATDHALDLGLRAGADVLVCSPCCHKELRPQMTRPRLLSGLLRHGIHLGQEAEMVTDSLRALLLETCGYDARVFEFVSLEHTGKNKMILATRRSEASERAARAGAEVSDLKSFYGIREQCLETLLQRRGRSGEGPQACQTP